MHFLCLSFLCPTKAFTQPQGKLLFQHLSVEQGLSQSSVYGILQDKQGFMWFATGDGLDRYDGKDFNIYKSRFDDTVSGFLKNRTINSFILEDNFNNLWVTTDAGLSRINKSSGSFSLKMGKLELSMAGRLIDIDSNNNLWLAVNQKGLYVINTSSYKKELYPLSPSQLQHNKHSFVFFSGITSSNKIWLADNAGLISFDKSSHKYENVLNNENLSAVFKLQDERLLLCTDNGVYLYNTQTGVKEFIAIGNKKKGTFSWISFAEYPATHTVYLGSSKGGELCSLNLQTKEYQFLVFQPNNINYLFIDRSENLWVGTEGSGLYKADLKPPKFYNFPPKPIYETPFDQELMVKSIYEDKADKIWIGSFNKGLILYDPATQKQTTIPLNIKNSGNYQFINEIMLDSSGHILIAVADHIVWIDTQTHKIIRSIQLPYNVNVSISPPVVTTVLEWRKDHFLIGTNVALYCALPVNGQIKAYLPQSFIGNPVYSAWTYKLQKAKNGTFFVGKRSGFAIIKVINDSTVKLIDNGFEQVGIRHFYEAANLPIVWMASEEGIVAYNTLTKKYKVFDERSGLSNSFIYAILPQNDTSLWLSSNSGLSNLNLQYDKNGDITTHFTNYTVNDGLQSNEFNTGAYFAGQNGTLFFGGINGINWFKPIIIHPNPHKAIPVITAVYINNKAHNWNTTADAQTINLPYLQNTLSFSFKALEYTNPDKNGFMYKLDGFDKEWQYTSNNTVRYPNMPAGQYVFLLKASNNDHLWNDNPVKIQIVINPPYWQTWWFKSLVVIIIVLIAYAVSRYYVKQKVKEKILFIEKEKALYDERLRISKDVHDDLGSGLSKITLMAETVKRKKHPDGLSDSTIENISQISKDLIGNMRDLIWVLNPENTTSDNLVARIREYSSEFLENMPTNVVLDFPEQIPSVPISHELQRNIFLTVKETLHNCLKHSGANEIRMNLRLYDKTISIKIADNGKGFNINSLKNRGNGLRNMKLRIENIKGIFKLNSDEKGTVVYISVPIPSLPD